MKAAAPLTKKARIPLSCVVSVVGICASDDGLRSVPPQNAQTPPNDKHYGHGDPCLILKFLIRFYNRLSRPVSCQRATSVRPGTSLEAIVQDILVQRRFFGSDTAHQKVEDSSRQQSPDYRIDSCHCHMIIAENIRGRRSH